MDVRLHSSRSNLAAIAEVMAGLKSRLRDELGRYFVHDLEDMNKHIGRGAYGEVVEMKMGDEIVAVKKLHGALLGAQDSQYIVSRFEEECKRYVLHT